MPRSMTSRFAATKNSRAGIYVLGTELPGHYISTVRGRKLRKSYAALGRKGHAA
jgi:hypothetical protein